MSVLRDTAKGFIDHSRVMGYRGKKRDRAATDFFTGAAVALTSVGSEGDARMLRQIVAVGIYDRGYRAVLDIIEQVTRDDL